LPPEIEEEGILMKIFPNKVFAIHKIKLPLPSQKTD